MRQPKVRLTMFRLTIYCVTGFVLFWGCADDIDRLAVGDEYSGTAIVWPVLIVILVMPVVIFFGEAIARDRHEGERRR